MDASDVDGARRRGRRDGVVPRQGRRGRHRPLRRRPGCHRPAARRPRGRAPRRGADGGGSAACQWQWPDPDENPLGAWYVRCSIGGGDGPLGGLRVAVKDNIAVAGVPMTDGSALLDGYVPSADATVVARVLAAGGEIVGKAVCEDLCLSAGSHTASTGPVRATPTTPPEPRAGRRAARPRWWRPGPATWRSAATRAGSMRIPAAFCGIDGLKPTCGLVPYTGVDRIEPTDRPSRADERPTCASVALLLAVLAGPDGLDARQSGSAPAEDYGEPALIGAPGLRVGVVARGLRDEQSDHDELDDRCARGALDRLGGLGAVGRRGLGAVARAGGRGRHHRAGPRVAATPSCATGSCRRGRRAGTPSTSPGCSTSDWHRGAPGTWPRPPWSSSSPPT